MCGRYVLALVQRVLDDNGLPTDNLQGRFQRGRDYWGDGEAGDGADGADGSPGADDAVGGAASDNAGVADADHADADTHANTDTDTDADALFQPSYNFAPGFHGIVVRPVREDSPKGTPSKPRPDKPYRLDVMKWGLIPSWTKRRPDYTAMLRTINCRSDSLVGGSNMWARLRSRNRCVVVASGFYEWLSKGPRERVPHYIRRRDGLPLLMAGLWDRAELDGVMTDTYTIITTDANETMRFLHDRMPVLLDYGSQALAAWLDKDEAWSADLGSVLRPWPVVEPEQGGSLLVDVVSKEVNRTGHSSARFIVPVASADNKANIANFFADAPKKRGAGEAAEVEEEEAPPGKKAKTAALASPGKKKTDASAASPKMTKKTSRKSVEGGAGSQKITSFFGKG